MCVSIYRNVNLKLSASTWAFIIGFFLLRIHVPLSLSSFMCFLAPISGHHFLHGIITSKIALHSQPFLVCIFHHTKLSIIFGFSFCSGGGCFLSLILNFSFSFLNNLEDKIGRNNDSQYLSLHYKLCFFNSFLLHRW